MNFLGIISARAGSKGLKNKNFLKINKKTLIEIAIEEALKVKKLNKIIFSSESNIYLKKVLKYKNRIDLIKRPNNLSKDNSSIFDVIKHTLYHYNNKHIKFDYVVLLQPTTPFRKSSHIEECINKITKFKADSLISVKKPSYPIEWSLQISKDNISHILKKGDNLKRRQEADNKIVIPSGYVYIFKSDLLLNDKNFKVPSNKTIHCMINNKYSINIDNEEDYYLAKFFNRKYGII